MAYNPILWPSHTQVAPKFNIKIWAFACSNLWRQFPGLHHNEGAQGVVHSKAWTVGPDDQMPVPWRPERRLHRSDTVKKYVPKVWNTSLLFGRQCHAPLTHWDLDILYCTCSKNVAHADRKDYQTYAMKSIESTKLIWNGIKGWQSWQHKGFNHIIFDSFDKLFSPNIARR